MQKKSESRTHRIADAASKGAAKSLLDELLQDMYDQRWQLYKLNFFRGLFFAFGGVIGGTIVITFLLWLLSFFDQLPVVGNFVDTIQRSIEAAQQ